MGNAILVAALVLAIVFAVKNSAKHFRGEGGCCGGGGGVVKNSVPVKKLDGKKLGEKVVSISGMHCSGCAASVAKAINRIDGASAHVVLKKNQAVVSYDKDVSEEAIRKAVEAEGFQVTGIQG